MKQLITVVFLFYLTLNTVEAQSADSTKIINQSVQGESTSSTVNSNQEPIDDDFAPGLLFLLLIACAAVLICIGIGIAIAVMVLLIIFGLIGVGILSASVLVGLNKKSLALGFKTFVVSVSIVGGVILSSALFWILNEFQHWWTYQTALAIGAGIGLVAGLIFGLILFFVLQRLTSFLRSLLSKNTKDQSS